MDLLTIKTERLILRKFNINDLDALYKIFSDEEVNKFLPWMPLKTLDETKLFYESKFTDNHFAYSFAVCLKEDNYPIGYVTVSINDSHDFGYGLRKEFWHKGIVTEAGLAIIKQLRKDGVKYITATHDINNARSGEVMKRLGMKYQYSYKKKCQPKDILVTFRMYQLNLDLNDTRVYSEYWNSSVVRFVEKDV